MQLEHSFTVPVGVEDAWQVLIDIERIAPCLPGAVIDSVDGADFTGSVKVKLGPIGLTYKGKASFVERDAAAHRAVIDARGRDTRGNGTANAKVTATLVETGTATTVQVLTELDITGKPAQFGRGVMVDVGNKLIGQFADCLAGKLTAGPGSEAPASATAPASEPKPGATPAPTRGGAPAPSDEPDQANRAPRARPPAAQVEPINLIQSAGPAVAKRLAPVLGLALLLLGLLRRRRRR